MPHTHHDSPALPENIQPSKPDSGDAQPRDSALDADGLDRRNFLSCMAWVGTGLLWTITGGVPRSSRLGAQTPGRGELFFMQISDSHIGFDKAANTDVTATLRAAIGKINAMPIQPAFLLHTGDITQLSKPSEFDTADQVLREARTEKTFFVPGEHDVGVDAGASYLERYGKGTQRGRDGGGWYSFDHSGVHFMGLVNVLNLKAGGLGSLGAEQLAWIERDVKNLSSSTPIVVFAHVPLWSVYPEWGWGTDDGARALGYLKRFGSVTVLNGHIHQTMQKVEGNVAFHTALSTAFPQPRPGTAPSPGPMVVPAGQLRDVLGVREVHYVPSNRHLAVVDHTLSGNSPDAAFAAGEAAARAHASSAGAVAAGGGAPMAAPEPGDVNIANFAFTPKTVTVSAGSKVTWRNGDDVPHKIQSADNRFRGSPLLDTKGVYSVDFKESGEFGYFCSLHPVMQGKIVVTR
jgi:3',5'-cyclic-AMP phosphodiesterase